MRRSLLVLIAAMAVGIATTPSQAGTASATYVAGVGVKQPVNRTAQNIHAGVGGVVIKIPAGTKPTAIKANDEVGAGKILVTVCQTNGVQCGTAGSVTQWFCLSDNSSKALQSTKPWNSEDVHVWVYAEETPGTLFTGSIPCPDSAAAAGTVTVTYA